MNDVSDGEYRKHFLGVAVLLSACTETPIDVVVLQASAGAGQAAPAAGGTPSVFVPPNAPTDIPPQAGTGGTNFPSAPLPDDTDAGDGTSEPAVACGERAVEVTAGVHRLQLAGSLECLTTGERTTVVDLPAFETALDPTCSSEGAYFELIFNERDVYEVRSVPEDFNLDVRQASTRSGTPLVLFGAHRLDNQRFHFNPRGTDTFEIAPVSVPTYCVTRLMEGLQIWPCDDLDPAQSWHLLPGDCG